MEFKVGDVVYTEKYGSGKIIDVDYENNTLRYVPYKKNINLIFVVASFDEVYKKIFYKKIDKLDITDLNERNESNFSITNRKNINKLIDEVNKLKEILNNEKS